MHSIASARNTYTRAMVARELVSSELYMLAALCALMYRVNLAILQVHRQDCRLSFKLVAGLLLSYNPDFTLVSLFETVA
jgi:hypothetical protein